MRRPGTASPDTQEMSDPRFNDYRFFLKDAVRCRVDFGRTAQSLGEPPPPVQKPCPDDLPRVDLPDGRTALAQQARMPLGEAVIRRQSRREYGPTPLTLAEISLLLWATQGIRRLVNPGCALRSVPSAGARHAFETYMAVQRVESLEPGLYRYLPLNGQLAQLSPSARIGRDAAIACLGQGFVAAAAVTFFWTAIPARMEWRYDIAAHKVIALDAGHVCQNLYLACEAIGAGTCAIAAYDQEACDRLLGVDGDEEFTIYVAAVGKRRD